jgi:hypothetical protein
VAYVSYKILKTLKSAPINYHPLPALRFLPFTGSNPSLAISLDCDCKATPAFGTTQVVFLMCPYPGFQLARDKSTKEVLESPSRHCTQPRPTTLHHAELEVAPPTLLYWLDGVPVARGTGFVRVTLLTFIYQHNSHP